MASNVILCIMFQQRYLHNPGSLIRIIRHCLNTELKLVQQVENVSNSSLISYN